MDFLKELLNRDIISEYSHANNVELVGTSLSFHMDCSGFVNWCLFQMGYKRALAELRMFLRANDFIKINRFFCKDFSFVYKNKHAFKYWKFIPEPVSGCILFVVFPDGGGHCMFVDKIVIDKNILSLSVIDSTCYPHKNDSRIGAVTGIGQGEVGIIYNNDGVFYDSGNPNLPIRKADIYFVLPIK